MKQRPKKEQESAGTKQSFYEDAVFDSFDQKPQSAAIESPLPIASEAKPETQEKSYKLPDKLFRRNITLSEEQFRKLEFIKKKKNKERSKDDELVTLDRLMFDMIQHCLDTQYPEADVMFEKYLKIKEMEGFSDLM